MLGQRLPYVLLAGKGKQDESSEDPLTAAKVMRSTAIFFSC